jgi:FlaA1/EpsC-like NDP-sugar epimerase
MYLELGGVVFAQHVWPVTWGLLCCLAMYIVAFRLMHTYLGVIRYSSFADLQRVVMAALIGGALSLGLSLLLQAFDVSNPLMPGVTGICIMMALTGLLMGLVRIVVKRLFDMYRASGNKQKVFIYGAQEGGVGLAQNIQSQSPQKYSLAGFVSPFGDLETKYLMGVQVRRDGPNLLKHMKETGATVMLVSPLQTDYFRERENLINDLIDAGIKIMMIPSAEEWDGKSTLRQGQLRQVEIEDLLPREKIEVDMDAIGALLKGKKILITGAAGSIGSEMVRQVAVYKPTKMVLIDQAETPMHDLRLLMARQYADIEAWTIVSNIANKEHMEKIFAEHRPDYVFHAAAYKHVPMMEDNPTMAVQNNVYGTRVIADLAVKYGTKKFVMISTDKAVNPTNVMGCSKRICEIYCQALSRAIQEGRVQQADGTPAVTQFVTTRFGNVLGSNGSVIPLFKKQIAQGGPITVTHPDIIRYFMLIPEACKLVLEAGTMGKGGEIFVFDMGKPVKIVDLAKRMIYLSGVKDIEIKFTGLRDGEKLYEEVLSYQENTRRTHHPKILVAEVREYSYDLALKNEEELYELSFSFDDMAIVKKMKEIVPEYKSCSSKYEVLDK